LDQITKVGELKNLLHDRKHRASSSCWRKTKRPVLCSRLSLHPLLKSIRSLDQKFTTHLHQQVL